MPPGFFKQMDGARIERPATERVILLSEVATQAGSGNHGAFQRVLDSFIFLVDKKPAAPDIQRFAAQEWKGVGVIGAVASITGKGGLFAQSGWFNRVTWLWMHIPVVTQIKVASDNHYRGGEPCIWLNTPLGDYAVLSPHKLFAPQWEGMLGHLMTQSAFVRFERIKHEAPKPLWWDNQALDKWPSGTSPDSLLLTKRPPSTGLDDLEKLSLDDPLEEGNESSSLATQPRRVKRREGATYAEIPVSYERTSQAAMGMRWDLDKSPIVPPFGGKFQPSKARLRQKAGR